MSKSRRSSCLGIRRAVDHCGGVQQIGDLLGIPRVRVVRLLNGTREAGPLEAIKIEKQTNGLVLRENLLESLFDEAWQQRNPPEHCIWGVQ
ncbi:YdaS family helix-turn-helix protein [Acidithiobacillus thiooxidans]|uniref:YdaS family helix-turn-helix protein n=1 Tax=Acidithiobacillus thiooxidans TaxID=930 RepID=UPI0034E96B6D